MMTQHTDSVQYFKFKFEKAFCIRNLLLEEFCRYVWPIYLAKLVYLFQLVSLLVKHNSYVFNYVGALERPFQSLNINWVYPIRNQFVLFMIIVLLKHPNVSKFQTSDCCFEVNLPSSLFSICAPVPQRDTTTAMLDVCLGVLSFESLTSKQLSICLIIVSFIRLVHVGSCKFQSKLKVFLEQRFFFRTLSVSVKLVTPILVVPGLYLDNQTNCVSFLDLYWVLWISLLFWLLVSSTRVVKLLHAEKQLLQSIITTKKF